MNEKEEKVDSRNTLQVDQTGTSAKKVLFYTKFEGNTAGDEKFLEIIRNALVVGLDKDAEIGLYLAYDEKSEQRAENAINKWLINMQDRGFKKENLKVWAHEAPVEVIKPKKDVKQVQEKTEQGTALLSKCMPTVAKSKIKDCENLNATKLTVFINKKPAIDLFVVAGWAHQLNQSSAQHIKDQLKIPLTSKILLCAPPGGYIDNKNMSKLSNECSMKTELLKFDYHKIYCLQPGVFAKGGLLISPSITLEALQESDTRKAWLTFVEKNLSVKEWEQVEKRFKDVSEKERDECIVIYCSKDKPGDRGREFIENIIEKNYPVILIGTNDKGENSDNYVYWETLCEENSLTVYSMPRTSTSEVLMRGLQDAEYAMATGAFSILEAKKLGLHHCAYLSPPHLQDFAFFIEESGRNELEIAFRQGEKTLEELSRLPKINYLPNILHADNALADKGQEIIEAQLTEITDEVIEQRNRINKYMKEHMPEKYELLLTSQMEYLKYREEDNEEAHDKYIEIFAQYKKAFGEAQSQFSKKERNEGNDMDERNEFSLN